MYTNIYIIENIHVMYIKIIHKKIIFNIFKICTLLLRNFKTFRFLIIFQCIIDIKLYFIKIIISFPYIKAK